MEGKVTLRQFLGLYAMYARMDLSFLVRDWRLSLMSVCADMLSNVASVTGVFLLAWRFDGVGGMNRWEVLFMLGYVTCVTGMWQMFFAGCKVGHISRRIGRGQIDHMLIQPLPLAVQLATEGFLPFTGCQNLLCGIAILVLAARGLRLEANAPLLAGLALYLSASVATIAGLSYLFSALAFRWQIAFEEISSTVVDDLTGVLSNYPLSGMPVAMQWTLVTVIPAGLLGWFPACALLGKAPLGLPVFYPLIAAAVVWAFAALAFRRGLKYYVKIGSNRYSAGGHRR
jgi:ABC-2 type transport system permease protein